jgi:hypothetical protein
MNNCAWWSSTWMLNTHCRWLEKSSEQCSCDRQTYNSWQVVHVSQEFHFVKLCQNTLTTRARWKVLDLAYNWCESRNKWPLRRDPDRNWCHLHTSVKLFGLQPMAPWTTAAAYKCAAAQSMDPWAVTKKALH